MAFGYIRCLVSHSLNMRFAKNFFRNRISEPSVVFVKNYSSAPSKFSDVLLETAFEETDNNQTTSTATESSTASSTCIDLSQDITAKNIVQLVSVKPNKISFDESGAHATLNTIQRMEYVDYMDELFSHENDVTEHFEDNIFDKYEYYNEQHHFDIPDFAPIFIFRHVTTPEELMGPVLNKTDKYKNPEYFHYGRFTFFDLERELQDQRNKEHLPEFEPDLINLRYKKNK